MLAAQVSWLQAYLATLATVQVLGLAIIGALVARRLPPPSDSAGPASGELVPPKRTFESSDFDGTLS